MRMYGFRDLVVKALMIVVNLQAILQNQFFKTISQVVLLFQTHMRDSNASTAS